MLLLLFFIVIIDIAAVFVVFIIIVVVVAAVVVFSRFSFSASSITPDIYVIFTYIRYFVKKTIVF